MADDLIQITSSRTRRAILELFFRDQGKEYYLRQIEDIIGFSAGNIRREMLKLEQGGLFLSRILGNVKLYRLNIHHPIHNEIRNIVRKTIGVEGRLKAIINKHRKIKFAFIYGSFAKHEEKGLSDVDIIIIGDISPKEIKLELYRYQAEIQREINSIVYCVDEFLNKLRNKNHFLNTIIKEPKVFLKGSNNEFREFIQIRKAAKA